MLKKLTIEEMHLLANDRNGKCLSQRYINSKTKLTWMCSVGHIWEAAPSKIKTGQWCQDCARKRSGSSQRLTIKDMQKRAEDNGGKCLSKRYVNAKAKLKWECAEGHTWEAQPSNIQSGCWCPECGTNSAARAKIKYSIRDMQKWAEERGGKCLSTKYDRFTAMLLWKCSEGHEWEAPFSRIKTDQWCPECGGAKKLTIDDMHKLAKVMKGRCLSNKYVNARSKLKWECKEKHVWETTPGQIRSGSWCPVCNVIVRANRCRGSIEEMQLIAEERGGECLSKQYVTAHVKLKWKCGEGHEWKASSYSIKRGSWCPQCSDKRSERICRIIFQKIFKKKFPSVWPNWLRNSDGNIMELDGYCKSLNLAFEYQGEQHFSLDTYYIKDNAKLDRRKKLDKQKKRICTKKGITLIDIMPFKHNHDIIKIIEYLQKQFVKNGIDYPSNIKNIKLTSREIYVSDKLDEFVQLANKRGGKCLSNKYVSATDNLLWQCELGHEWEANAANIKSGTWCPVCSGNKRLTIEDMHLIAKERGGKCLSKKYVNSSTKLKWKCSEGHMWEAMPSDIKFGKWCPDCAGTKRLTIENMQLIAMERGGKCLSKEYINNRTKLPWECGNGHKWEAPPHSISNGINRKGTWCPVCGGTKKLTIDDMHKLAKERGGKCLSKKYVNNRTKLKWKCGKCECVWDAKPGNIKFGKWCPVCGIKKRAATKKSN